MVWESPHALSDDIAAEAQLDRDIGGKELLLQAGRQAAHVT